MFAESRKPTKNSAADTHRYTFWLTFPARKPHTSPPMQKKLITIVNVSDSCAALHCGNSAAIGPDSTLHAYTSPLSSSATHPTMTYTHLFTTFMFSSIFKKVYILG